MTFSTFGLENSFPGDAFSELRHLAERLEKHAPRNKARAQIYDMHNRWKDLGVAIPPRFRSLEVASGWGQKAVDHLARRVRMENFTIPGGQLLDSSGIQQMWEDNHMDIDLPQAITSAMIHSPGFLLTMLGDPELKEPDVVFSSHDAMSATGRWNWSRRGLDSALVILDSGDDPTGSSKATRFIFFHEDTIYEARRDTKGGFWSEEWTVETFDNTIGRVPVEPLLYHPRVGRPFGGSRITPACIYIIQAAMRTMARAELGAEFFAAPQRYGLNIDEEDLLAGGKTQWDVVIGKMLTLGASSSPEDPDPFLGQFPQVSMQPHSDMLRMWATLFAGETGIPVGSLGVVQDNPSSAEALYAAKEDLILEAEECTRFFTPSIRRTAWNAVQLKGRTSEIPEELKRLSVRWIDPSTPSRNQAADYVMKQVAGGVLPAESTVTLELLGHSREVIERIEADRRLSNARQTIREALAVNVQQPPVAPPTPPTVEAPAVGAPKVQAVGQFREDVNLPQK